MTADAPVTEKRLIEILEEVLEAKLEEKLDQKLDQKLDKRFSQFEAKMDEKLELKLAEAVGQMNRYFDKRFTAFEKRLSKRVDDMYMLLDRDSARIDDDYVERAVMNGQLDRHERWINELADNTGTTLSTS